MHPVFRHNRLAWLAYLRACHEYDEQKRREGDRFSDSSIIPFGAASWWGETEARRVAEATAHPLPAHIVAVGETEMAEGVTVAVNCPFCRQTHEHVFLEWPARAIDAPCAKGRYVLSLPNICTPDGKTQD